MKKQAPKRKMVFYADRNTEQYLKSQSASKACSISQVVCNAIFAEALGRVTKDRKHGKS